MLARKPRQNARPQRGGRMSKTVREYLIYDGRANDVPEDLNSIGQWASDLLEDIPDKFRSSARLEIESESGDESCHHISIQVYYERPETQEEAWDRLEKTKAYEEGEIARLRARLAALESAREKGKE